MEFTIEFQLLSFSEKKVDQIYLFKLQPINHLFIFFNTVNQIFKLVIKKIVSRTALRGVLRTIFGTIFRHFSRKFAAALGKREKLTNITQWVILGGQMGGRLLCIKSLYNILIYY